VGRPASHSRQPTHLVIARILSPHGVKGEVQAELLTDFPERFGRLKTLYLGEERRPEVLEGHRMHGRRILLKFARCDDCDQAGELRGELIYVPVEEAIPLGDDEYYLYEIVGLRVWTTEGEYLGRVVEVLHTGSNDVYVVREADEEILIPAISDVVLKIDVDEGRIEVRLTKGLR
jgi:16S rRNA processing protein RimM